MRINLLRRSDGNTRLILIFSGWSSHPSMYAPAARDGWDLAVVDDYRSPELDKSILSGYHTIYIYAWSLGVFMASRSMLPGEYTAAFAIYGTESPVGDPFGIPEHIYRGTQQSLDQRNLMKFRLRMAGNRELIGRLAPAEGESDDIARLKDELEAISRMQREPGERHHFIWNRAYIATADRIIPADAQRRFWLSRPEVATVEIDGPHLPDLAAITAATIPDLERVANRFREALPTYDRNATAQRAMAARLLAMTLDAEPERSGAILELGPGSGLFTRMWSERLSPRSADFVDLYPTDRYAAAPCERYFVADAEQWMEQAPDAAYDIILSASCIQWFVNPERFFHNACRALRPGGILAFSTFAPGNLRELDAMRPTPLSYPDPRELELELRRIFPAVEVCRETHPVDFPDKLSALRHIRLTGVGGISSGRLSLSGLRGGDAPFRLTYEAFYAVARKQTL